MLGIWILGYLSSDDIMKLLSRLHFALSPGGILILNEAVHHGVKELDFFHAVTEQ